MPIAKGLFPIARFIESGLRSPLTDPPDAIRHTENLLAELGLRPGQIRELQNVPWASCSGERVALEKWTSGRRAGRANTPMIDGKIVAGPSVESTGPAALREHSL